MSGRVIFHIDLNSFFASVEMILQPHLQKHPVAVARTSSQRHGIVVTSNYEARAHGVYTTMPVWKARQVCRDLVIVPPHFEEYRRYSSAFIELLQSYSSFVEQASIDEAYVDVTDSTKQNYVQLAEEIQASLLKKLGLPCSIGIAPNKFLAKMASDMKKPLGISILRKRDWPTLFYDQPVEEIHGVGDKTGEHLRRIGIQTIGALAKASPAQIIEHFGPKSVRLIEKAQGIDDRPVDPERAEQRKSVGVSSTFHDDLETAAECHEALRKLSERLSVRLKEKGLWGYRLTVQMKDSAFRVSSKTYSLEKPVQQSEAVAQEAVRLHEALWDGRPVRLLGVTASEVGPLKPFSYQLNLFTLEQDLARYSAGIEEGGSP
ncbi:DNA polymerase IV [Bacillaceae bacterium SIJ1]|uniref:DNA polymerase IV n=1 Tax=Litoribacterium kuwaitense TaxID=1398745 RepID=UPI0013EA8378|nr:DNA polymerase IV [Litoribacterium kuwaitense]NGP43632.1 DNA polymerase IV [Litoribacterium kuwaitense]